MTTLSDMQSRSGVAEGAYLVTKALTDLPGGVAEGLCVGAAGTCNLMFANGDLAVDFPLQAGYNPLRVIQVQTGGTSTAANIWALK
jgi:hypothetical protein